MSCSNPISPSLITNPNPSSSSSSSSSPTLSQSNPLHDSDHQSTPATFKTRTHLLRNHSNRSHHRSFSQGTVPLSPSNSTNNSSTITTTTTTTHNESSSNYIYVQPASPLYEPNKFISHHHHQQHSNSENLHQNSNHPTVDPPIDQLTVRSRRARLPYFTPLIQPRAPSFPRRSPPKSPSLITPTHTSHNTTINLVRVHDYAHPPSHQPIHYISTSNSNHSPPHDPSKLGSDSSSQIKRPLHQKAKSETGSNGMRIELGSHSNSSHDLLSIDHASLDLGTPMLRKKSGEVVRSSLKETRAKSAPATPTGPKYVHFDSHLEHVKHFLSQQRPAAVSRDGSPIETETEGEEEFPFPMTISKSRLVLELVNFPIDSDSNARMNRAEVYLRWIELSTDGKTLKGQVQVKNLSFEKLVAIRFTFDSWQTVSEVMAEYIESISNGQFDRFSFSIRLVDQLARIEDRKMLIAIRYTTNGQEIWDNNSGANYDVRFKKVRSTGGSGVGINSHSFKPQSSATVPHHPSPDLSNLPTNALTTSASPVTTAPTVLSPITTEPTQSTLTPTASPYQWSVTTEGQAQDRMAELRAELDRLVGDDLGLSMPSQPTFKTSLSIKDESPKLESSKKLDCISAGNHIKLNSLTPFASRYDFTSSLKQAVISPRFEERKWSFGYPSPNFDSSTSSSINSTTSTTSDSTITDSVPRSELFIRTSPEVELGVGMGSGMGHGSMGSNNGQAVLESLRAFQEQKLKGGHNLEPSDYGELVQNFCWGGVEEMKSNSFLPSSVEGYTPNGLGLSSSHSEVSQLTNAEKCDKGEIGILLESVQARFGSPPTAHHHHHHHHPEAKPAKVVGLGITEGSGI
ncbi:carbohydrate-binding module family 21 [Melampsora americana]|nr:carbohydrate-binding module family 21 [Melampsora americana]